MLFTLRIGLDFLPAISHRYAKTGKLVKRMVKMADVLNNRLFPGQGVDSNENPKHHEHQNDCHKRFLYCSVMAI